MGRAIVRNPQAFLMDEPLSNLDAKLRVEMRAEISRIQRDLGVTTIYVTHDQTEALTMGDRVAVMRNGFLQHIAVPKELYDEPRNLFVAEFIGSPAMNVVLADVEQAAQCSLVSFGPHRLTLVPETLDALPGGLRGYAGRRVVLGNAPRGHRGRGRRFTKPRPEHRISVVCDIREDVGSDVYVHFNVAADPVQTAEVMGALVVEDAEDEEARFAAERARGAGTTFVARLDRATRARERERLDLEVDVTRLHFFDPETGVRVGDGS